MINMPVFYAVFAVSSVNFIIQILAALGIFTSRTFGILFFGILLVLLVGVYQFIGAVLQSMNATEASN
jgi:hypothetical protein